MSCCSNPSVVRSVVDFCSIHTTYQPPMTENGPKQPARQENQGNLRSRRPVAAGPLCSAGRKESAPLRFRLPAPDLRSGNHLPRRRCRISRRCDTVASQGFSFACALPPAGVSWLAAKQRGGGAGLRGMLRTAFPSLILRLGTPSVPQRQLRSTSPSCRWERTR